MFFQLADPDESKWMDSDRQPSRVAEVCRFWRAVALCCPTLWSTVTVLAHHNPLTLQLERSKPAYLTVNIWFSPRVSYEEFDRAVSLTFEHSDRFITFRLAFDFDVSGISSEMERLEELFANASMPVLDTLDLQCDEIPYYEEPRGLLSNKAIPSLRNLNICFMVIPWTSPIFQGLTSLCVTQHNDWCPQGGHQREVYSEDLKFVTDYYRVTLQQLLGIPRQCPEIVSLELTVNVVDSDEDSIDPEVDSVDLPCLTNLFLNMISDFYSPFLNHFVLPPLLQVQLC